MTKKIALFVGLAAIVGVLAIKTVTMAITIGTIHCIYSNHTVEQCTGRPHPQPIEEGNKNQG
jgi:hypothetical protein